MLSFNVCIFGISKCFGFEENCIVIFKCEIHNHGLNVPRLPGVLYYTVLSQGSSFGAIKYAHLPTFSGVSDVPVHGVDIGLQYIMHPGGIAVDWIGRWCLIVKLTVGPVLCRPAHL